MASPVIARSVTLRDIAERAGVSVATVSRALAGRGELSRRTRERVADAADALGYERGATQSGRPTSLDPHLIEFVLGSFDDAWTDAVTSGARDAAFVAGYDLVLTLERSDPRDDWPTRVATRRPSGVIIGIIQPTRRQLTELRGLRIPVVLFDPRSEPDAALSSVGTTDWQGGYDAGAHLAECGYDRFVVVTGSPQYRFGRAREDGFRAAIAERRPDAEVHRVQSAWSNAPLTEDLVRPLTYGDAVGVFACNDEMALAVYRAAHAARRRIPADVGVVGFNDEARAAGASPALTSVRQPLSDMAARAVRLVSELREHGAEARGRLELPTELIVRASTRGTT